MDDKNKHTGVVDLTEDDATPLNNEATSANDEQEIIVDAQPVNKVNIVDLTEGDDSNNETSKTATASNDNGLLKNEDAGNDECQVVSDAQPDAHMDVVDLTQSSAPNPDAPSNTDVPSNDDVSSNVGAPWYDPPTGNYIIDVLDITVDDGLNNSSNKNASMKNAPLNIGLKAGGKSSSGAISDSSVPYNAGTATPEATPSSSSLSTNEAASSQHVPEKEVSPSSSGVDKSVLRTSSKKASVVKRASGSKPSTSSFDTLSITESGVTESSPGSSKGDSEKHKPKKVDDSDSSEDYVARLSDPSKWSIQEESCLFLAAMNNKPVGHLRHFQMAVITKKFYNLSKKCVPPDILYKKLGTFYNLAELDKKEPLPLSLEIVDFMLPSNLHELACSTDDDSDQSSDNDESVKSPKQSETSESSPEAEISTESKDESKNTQKEAPDTEIQVSKSENLSEDAISRESVQPSGSKIGKNSGKSGTKEKLECHTAVQGKKSKSIRKKKSEGRVQMPSTDAENEALLQPSGSKSNPNESFPAVPDDCKPGPSTASEGNDKAEALNPPAGTSAAAGKRKRRRNPVPDDCKPGPSTASEGNDKAEALNPPAGTSAAAGKRKRRRNRKC